MPVCKTLVNMYDSDDDDDIIDLITLAVTVQKQKYKINAPLRGFTVAFV